MLGELVVQCEHISFPSLKSPSDLVSFYRWNKSCWTNMDQSQSGAGADGGESPRGHQDEGCNDIYCYLSLTQQQAACLDTEEIKEQTGAVVDLSHQVSSVSSRRTVIVRGSPSQIEAAAKLIDQKTGDQENTAQTQIFWLQWTKAAFPDLDSRAHFLPPVYINRMPMITESVSSQNVLVLQSAPTRMGLSNTLAEAQTCTRQTPGVQESDIRDDAAMQRLLFCLQKMANENKEILVAMSQLQFGQYLREPCYVGAAAQLPIAANLPASLSRKWKQGDFDVLLIHRHHGLVVCEVKAFGDNIHKLNMSQQDIDNNIRKKLRDAVSQLDKAEAMLSHLVSDIAPGLRITKTIAFPNLTGQQLQQAISGDTKLIKTLCRCLGTTDPADIAGVCLCSDQLSDPKTPCDVSSHVLRELGHWWQRRVAGAGPDTHMTLDLFKSLVARFCGPATTVSVPWTSPPRVSVKTLGQAVWCTGECYTAVITLFPEQVHLLHTAPPRLFVTGPPGTGKTVVLLLMAIQWLRCGHDVYIVSTCDGSRAACIMLYHLLLQTVNTQQSAGVSPGQPHLLQYDLGGGKDVEKAVKHLSQAAIGGSLYVIADEVVSHDGTNFMIKDFETFCDKLMTRVPRLHLWATSFFHRHAPDGWQVEYLTRPLRSPPAVDREVQSDLRITVARDVHPYNERGVPDHTDGPPVRRLYHRGQRHSGDRPVDCVTCGREVASFLHSLRVGAAENVLTTSTTVSYTISGTTPPCLQWRDVLVLTWGHISDNSGMVKGLEEADIPVRVMKDDNIEDVATACSDVVWVAGGRRVRGLERKVVVCLDDVAYDSKHWKKMIKSFSSMLSGHFDPRSSRLDLMSRCTSQLVIVSPGD